MSICRRSLATLGGLAILLAPILSHAQTPTVRFSLLDGTPAAGSSFPSAVGGNPLDSHNPAAYILQMNYTFTLGSPLTPGTVEIGGNVVDSDPVGTSAVDLIGGLPGSSGGGIPLFNGLNPGASFFTPNVGADGITPTWSVFNDPADNPLLAGNSENLDLGHLNLTNFLKYVNNTDGVGTWNGELDYGLLVVNHANGSPLPIITPGPPSVDITVTIMPHGSPVPEPGAVAMLTGLGISGAGLLLRRRRR